MSDVTVRFPAVEVPDKDYGVDLCDHIKLPNAYETSGSREYSSDIEIRCEECQTTHHVTELIN